MIIYAKTNIKDQAYHHSETLDYAGLVIDYNQYDQIIGVEMLGIIELEKWNDFGEDEIVFRDEQL